MRTILNISIIFLIAFVTYLGCDKRRETEQPAYPIKISEGGLILLSVRVADTVEARFILDTGAGIHVVSNSLLRRVVSTPQGRFTGFRHTGERIDLDIFQIEALSIGGFRQEKPIVATWSLLDSVKIDGILSMKFFEHHPFTLDLRDSVLVFETSNSISDRAKTSRFVPIKVANIRGKSLDVFADFQVSDTLRLECIIDTGSPATIIDAGYLNALGIDTTSSTVQKKVRKSLFGVSETEYITTIPTISIWDAPSSTVKNLRTTFKCRLIYDGLVGTDFLLGRRITFDIAGGHFLVSTDSQ